MSVGFADKDCSYYLEHGYIQHESEIGKVYIPESKAEVSEKACIRYEKHPWIECFELDGIKPKPIKRTGYGTKDEKGFVQSLSTIYAKAYQEYAEHTDNATFFSGTAENFVRNYTEENETKMFGKFCGFVENMWREGNKEMHDIAMNDILAVLERDGRAFEFFLDNITDEFREYINNLKK